MTRTLLDDTTIDKPSKEKIDMGDLAINCKNGEELIVLKNDKDELCSFSTDEVIEATFEQIIDSAGFNEKGKYVAPTETGTEVIKDATTLSDADTKLAKAITTANTNISGITESLTDIKTAIKDALTIDKANDMYLGKNDTAKNANQVIGTLTINGYTYNGSKSVTLTTDGGGSGGGSSTFQYASKNTYGIVKIGDGINVDDGIISCKTQLSPASTDTLGGVKIGDGISIDNEGKISFLDYATTEITNDNGLFYSAEKYGGYITCLLDGSPTLYGSPDWLTCGSLVKFIGMDGKGINLPFYTCTPDNSCVPSAGDNSDCRYVRTTTKFGTGELHKMTMAEMKQLIGRKFYLMNTESTGMMTVYYGVPMNENKDGSTTYISWDNKDTDYMSVGIPVGGTLIMECCLGGYKYDDVYYECIYWKYLVNIGTPLVEFDDGGAEE